MSHPEFGQGENYWKGPIWVQMNFLALKSLYTVRSSQDVIPAYCSRVETDLQRYAAEEGPHQERAKKIYTELRKNIIDNVFKEYKRTGYVWEQYDPLTGEGRRRYVRSQSVSL